MAKVSLCLSSMISVLFLVEVMFRPLPEIDSYQENFPETFQEMCNRELVVDFLKDVIVNGNVDRIDDLISSNYTCNWIPQDREEMKKTAVQACCSASPGAFREVEAVGRFDKVIVRFPGYASPAGLPIVQPTGTDRNYRFVMLIYRVKDGRITQSCSTPNFTTQTPPA